MPATMAEGEDGDRGEGPQLIASPVVFSHLTVLMTENPRVPVEVSSLPEDNQQLVGGSGVRCALRVGEIYK